MRNIIEFQAISKRFGKIQALNNFSLQIKKNTIHAIVGENGSGKTTLMSILFGLLNTDEGKIFVRDQEQIISDPRQANNLGIAMAHQHFMLINKYTNLQNIILGHEMVNVNKTINLNAAILKVKLLQNRFNLHFDLDKITGLDTVANRQKVEIIKMLFQDSEVLIFDEPTAVLTDSEIQGLLQAFREFKKEGKTVIFISHKLKEVKAVSDYISVIRFGQIIGNYKNQDISINEIAKKMVGEEVSFPQNKHEFSNKELAFSIRGLSYEGHKIKIQNFNLDIFTGEIVAFAGVTGNGQEELELLLSGIIFPKKGTINLFGVDVTRKNALTRQRLGLAYVPGDIHKYALVMDLDLRKNAILSRFYNKDYCSKVFGFLSKNKIKQLSDKIINEFEVRGAEQGSRISKDLSGGNQQKFIFGREVTKEHKVLIVSQPTRGLDFLSTSKLHQKILEERQNNKAVILVSYILDEVLALSDRIIIFQEGEVVLHKKTKDISRAEIGLYISGIKRQTEEWKPL